MSIASCKLHTGVVNGLRCHFFIVFGREERVGAKRKPPAVGQLWVAPFRCDNIESHMKKQHPSKWTEHEAVKKSWKSFTKPFLRVELSDLFFTKKDDDTQSKKCSSDMDHFQNVVVSPLSSSKRNAAAAIEKSTVHGIDKDIVDVINGGMYYATPSHLL